MTRRFARSASSDSMPKVKPPPAMAPDRKAFFWIGLREALQTGSHVAFAAEDRETVDRFHQAALAAGGRDNGNPGCARTTTRLLRRVRARSGRPQYRGGVPPEAN